MIDALPAPLQSLLFTDCGIFRITGILGNYDMDETLFKDRVKNYKTQA